MQISDEIPRYKAILNPTSFDNDLFWKGIANYENGKLESRVIHAEQQVKSINIAFANNASKYVKVYYPNLEELIYMLTGDRIGDEQDENALINILTNCCMNAHVTLDILEFWSKYKTGSNSIPESQSEWSNRTNVINPCPSFIGHWNFELPKIEKEPLSSYFWLSVLAMAAGTLALIVAFAFLQAAAMSVSGVAVAAIGTASLLGGLSIFRNDWQKHSYDARRLEAQFESWRPATGPSPM